MATISGVIEVENSCFYIFDEVLDDQVSSIRFTDALLLPGVGATAVRTLLRDGFVFVTVEICTSEPAPLSTNTDTDCSDEVSYLTHAGSQRLREGTLGECFGDLATVLTPPGASKIHVRAARDAVAPHMLRQVQINAQTTFPEIEISEHHRIQVWSEPLTSPYSTPANPSSRADYTGPNNSEFDHIELQPGSTLGKYGA